MSSLHIGVIFKAGNLNYGESVGNIISLKKCSIEEQTFSYASRQALRYDMVRILEEECGYTKAEVYKGSARDVVQFAAEATIDKYPEIDFFGYMKTQGAGKGATIRKAIARISEATSLEPFYNEIDFSTNMGLAKRKDLNNDIFQTEIHRSYYAYVLTLDLDKVGVDENDTTLSISQDEKSKRVQALLYAIKILNRDIKGRRENLNPLFVIGGIYSSGNPFFYNQLKLSFSKSGAHINSDVLNTALAMKLFDGSSVKDTTNLGVVNGAIEGIDLIDTKEQYDIEGFFANLNNKIKEYYGANR